MKYLVNPQTQITNKSSDGILPQHRIDAGWTIYETNNDLIIYVNNKPKYKIINSAHVLTIASDFDSSTPLTDTQKWSIERSKRNQLLSNCDWTQMSDTSLTAQKVTDWATYRTSLRDVPQDNNDVDNITWPTEPT